MSQISPYGVICVAILVESHIAVHTWPEHGHASADIFICGRAINPGIAAFYMTEAIFAKEFSSMELKRGEYLSKTPQMTGRWK